MNDGADPYDPQCRAFYDHWRTLVDTGVDTGLMPHSRTYLNNVEPSLITMTHIVEVTAWGQRIRFMGTGLVELLGEDRTNKIIGSELPTRLKREFDERAFAVVNQPCGLYEVATFTRPSGRVFQMETIILPLAVDSGRPPRYCSYSVIVDPPDGESGRSDIRYKETASKRWIDLGNGVPLRTL